MTTLRDLYNGPSDVLGLHVYKKNTTYGINN